MSNAFRMIDTKQADGCYIQFERIEEYDDTANPKEYLFQEDEYQEQDQARFDAWKRYEWHFLGIIARAHVMVVQNHTGTMLTFDSPGLWGIESDSSEDYLSECFENQCNELKACITQFRNPIYS